MKAHSVYHAHICQCGQAWECDWQRRHDSQCPHCERWVPVTLPPELFDDVDDGGQPGLIAVSAEGDVYRQSRLI